MRSRAAGRASLVVLVSLVWSASIVAAAPSVPSLTVRHARAIHVTLGGRSEDASALRAAPGGWRLELAVPRGGAGTLVLRDVTVGAGGRSTFELPLAAASIVLDDTRFRPDHAYRIELRRGTVVVGTALIYLQPLKQHGPVVFDDGDTTAAPPAADGELPTTDKGAL